MKNLRKLKNIPVLVLTLLGLLIAFGITSCAVRGMIEVDGDRVLSSATLVNGVLVLRWLGKDASLLRQAFAEFWKAFRHNAGGQAPKLPRLWSV